MQFIASHDYGSENTTWFNDGNQWKPFTIIMKHLPLLAVKPGNGRLASKWSSYPPYHWCKMRIKKPCTPLIRVDSFPNYISIPIIRTFRRLASTNPKPPLQLNNVKQVCRHSSKSPIRFHFPAARHNIQSSSSEIIMGEVSVRLDLEELNALHLSYLQQVHDDEVRRQFTSTIHPNYQDFYAFVRSYILLPFD